MNATLLSVGDRIEVTTERLAYGGEAIARHQGLAIFIAFAAPAETLRVRITEKKKNFARAVIEEILTPSPDRITPRCKYFGDCGGCQWQHLRYENQLQAKVEFIRDALHRIAKIEWPEAINIVSAKEYNYRLRANLKIARSANQNAVQASNNEKISRRENPSMVHLGFFRAHSQTVCDIDRCDILLPELNDALQEIRPFVQANRKSSFQKHDEIFLTASDPLQTASENRAAGESVSVYPRLAGFNRSDVTRKVGGAVYQFTPATFFQVNALLLDDFVAAAIGAASGQLAIDLYAGVGLFTVQLARHFQKVIGVEANLEAVEYAAKNFALNNLRNAEIVAARADLWLRNFIKTSPQQTPDLIVLDPPRSGAAEALAGIARLAPPRIHYVSCDPMTLARDLKTLHSYDYKIEHLVAFDMFPQSYHVETIVFLRKT
ncbi:MAG: class I SAM-dependent RNA methyltransferase [Acidobacteria bacterium]|nr:class I SAM-dependent RNA methyltransferase [Acidobacteriota bacterium]